MGLQLACWGCGFESPRGDMHIYLCVCSALSGRGLCDGPIPRPEEFYRVCVCMCQSLYYIEYEANDDTPSISVFLIFYYILQY